MHRKKGASIRGWRAFPCALWLLPSLMAPIELATAEPLPTRPANGVDADIEAVPLQARQQLEKGRAEDAVQTILGLYSASDRYSAAQRQSVLPDCRKILQDAAIKLEADGSPEAAAVAMDARWQMDGQKNDVAHAQLLVRLAEIRRQDQREESLYLARRALLADGKNQAAARLERRLATNRFKVPGLLLLIPGVLAAAGGLGTFGYGVATNPNNQLSLLSRGSGDPFGPVEIAGLSVMLGGAVILTTGAILLSKGQAVEEPRAPVDIPALLFSD